MTLVALALLADALIGDPDALWRRVPHPVAWFGKAIAALDEAWNRGSGRRAKGAAALVVVVLAFAVAAAVVSAIAGSLPFGIVVEALIASIFLAHRSLHDHVRRVIEAPDLAAARAAVAMIVGRDTAELDEPGVARASLETLAESLSDGVVAPAFWLAVGGLPGLVAYKVVNTADSMIGHRTARHEAFGFAAARVDDVMNLVPARATAAMILLAGGAVRLWRRVRQEAGHHVSPNAGWPEAALAHTLNVALGGPRRYAGKLLEGAWFNEGGAMATFADVERGLALSRRVGVIQLAAYAALALV